MKIIVKDEKGLHFVAGILEQQLNNNRITEDEKWLLEKLTQYGYLEIEGEINE